MSTASDKVLASATEALSAGPRCLSCRWWSGERVENSWTDPYGSCQIIHGGGGNRKPLARVLPVGSSAWLETHRDFCCSLHEETKK